MHRLTLLVVAFITISVSCSRRAEAPPDTEAEAPDSHAEATEAVNTPAEPAEGASQPTSEASTEPAYLFVQTAQGVESSNGSLTLKSVSPSTIYFSDRPKRVAGLGRTADFLKMWGEGKDSFADDPPNATLSIFEGDEKVSDIVLALSNPKMEGPDLTYEVEVLEGQLPETGGAASLFIDLLIVRRPGVVVAGAPPPVIVRPAPVMVFRPHPVVVAF